MLNLPASYWHEWVAALDQSPAGVLPAAAAGRGRQRARRREAAHPVADSPRRRCGGSTPTAQRRPRSPPPSTNRPTRGERATFDRPDRTTVARRTGVRPRRRAAAVAPLVSPVNSGSVAPVSCTATSATVPAPPPPFLPDPRGPPGARTRHRGPGTSAATAGELEFLGRDDDQVKLRGHRIELEDVEAALGTLPAGRGRPRPCSREDVPGRPVLVGLRSSAGGGRRDWRLRAHLADRLPGYMVPFGDCPCSTGCRAVSAARPTGPHSFRRRWATTAGYAAPSSELERMVAAIWREVLMVEHVGADEDSSRIFWHGCPWCGCRSRWSAGGDPPGAGGGPVPPSHRARARPAPGIPGSPLPAPMTGGNSRAEIRRTIQRGQNAATTAEPTPRHGSRNDDRGTFVARHRHRRRRDALPVRGAELRSSGATWGEVESISTLSDADLIADGVTPEEFNDPGYVRSLGGRSTTRPASTPASSASPPARPEMLDPQHRIFLECAWQALEHAGTRRRDRRR